MKWKQLFSSLDCVCLIRKQPFTDQTMLSGGRALSWPHMGWRDSLLYSLVCAFLLCAQLQRSSQNDVATWFMFWFFLLCRFCFAFLSLPTWYSSFCSGMWFDLAFYFCHLSCILQSQQVFHHHLNIWKQVGFIKQLFHCLCCWQMHGRGKQWGCLELVYILSPLYQTCVFHRDWNTNRREGIKEREWFWRLVSTI